MQPFDPNLTQTAVRMMRQGYADEDVIGYLVQLGADAGVARALVDHLIALKRQAEALDPQRLRAEVAAMIAEGADYEDALGHLTSLGIAEQHARPEIDRLFAAHAQRVASMRPCDRCGTPTVPSEFYFDRVGNQVCAGCHAENEVRAAEDRAEDARLEAAGVPLHQIQQTNAVRWCPHCQDYTAELAHASFLISRGVSRAATMHRCTRCGQNV
jgi:hypothetical protein